jgi:hypothetical protein
MNGDKGGGYVGNMRLRRVLVTTLVALIAPAPDAWAQPAVSARVTDARTGKPIAGATISRDDGTPLAVADKNGAFTIGEVEPTVTLLVMADGFEASLITAADANGAEIVLLPSDVATEVIEVEGVAPPSSPGAARLDRDEIEHLPGTRGDVLASLDSLPGVTTPGFNGWAGVVIRGSAPEDSKILVDGFEIPILYHIGLRSIIPTPAIAGLEYIPGGFDVAYGRASSGIVAVTTRGGKRDFGGQAETSVIDSGVLAQGPAGKKGTFLVAVRRSLVDLILPSLIPDDADVQLTTVPHYWDGQARLDRELSSRWRAAISLLGTRDVAELIADDDAEDADERFYFETSFARLIADARYHDGPWSATLGFSPIAQRVHFALGQDIYYKADKLGGTARGEVTRRWTKGAGLRDIELRGGAELDLGRHKLDLATPEFEDEGEPEMENGPPDEATQFFDDAVWVTDVAAWTALSANLAPKIRLTAGLRVDGFARTGDVAVQPRGELAVTPREGTKVRLVAGAYRRPAEFVQELLETDLDPERATQTILGVEHALTPAVKLQASTYYTDRTHLLTRADDRGYDNLGRGTTYGAEGMVTLRRGGWFAFVSYSLSRSTRVDRPGAEERLFDYDQTHDLNMAATWKRGPWQIGGRFQYSSGTPDTEVMGSIYDSDRDRYFPVYGPINAIRAPAHHQLDVRVDRTWKLSGLTLTAFVDVANVYMNAPILGTEYSFDYSERNEVEGLPILPSIGMRGEL